MTGKEVYKIWAPFGVKWVDWVRPVPFISIDDAGAYGSEFYDFTTLDVNYINEKCNDTALIVDLPGYNSIKEGIALARMGYRPIPVYNGTNEQLGVMATTNNHVIGPALLWGAFELKKMNLNDDALPVFLLDSNRMHRFKMSASVFDNSWDIYPQDLPSADYFLENGINKIIIRGEFVQKDLKKILYKFQRKKIKIYFTNGYEEPKEIKIKKPSHKDI